MTALFDGITGPRWVKVLSMWSRLDTRSVMVRIQESSGHAMDTAARNMITVHGQFGTLCRTIPLEKYKTKAMTGVPATA